MRNLFSDELAWIEMMVLWMMLCLGWVEKQELRSCKFEF
jgi:hypothetical protein